MRRRDFLATGTVAAGAATLPAGAEPARAEAKLNLASQDGRIPGRSLAEKIDRMIEWGMQGVEVGGGNLANRVEEIKKALEGKPIKMSAVCAGYGGALCAGEEKERARAKNDIGEMLAAVAEIGSTGLIVVPAFNRHNPLPHVEARKVLVDSLKELGARCAETGARILLEPLNRGEAWLLRQLADAASICRDVNQPGICMMGDFYHMNIEETSDHGAFLSAGKWLHHVHLASRTRKLPGQDERSFVDGFRGLKAIGYQDYCSFECGCDGDPLIEIPKSLAFLREQWAQA